VFQAPVPDQHEDIFAPPEECGGDDLFGGPPPAPVIEMPAGPPLEEPTELLEPNPVAWQGAAGEPSVDKTVTFMANSSLSPPAAGDGAGAFPAEVGMGESLPGEHGEGGAAVAVEAPPRPVRKRPQGSMLGPLLLVFLVPYSIVTTAFIGWQMYSQSQTNFDPLQQLPDPKADKGGAKRIHPHSPMPTKLKTSLGQPLRVGDLEMTALSVQLNKMGQLGLHLKLRNASQDVAFNPVLPDEAYRFKRVSMADTGPYTYLEVGAKRLYGLGAEWEKEPPRKEGEKFDGILQPGEEMGVVFRTRQDDKAEVGKAAAKGQGTLLWRVQLRRGLVAIGTKEVSATAVFGIEFASRAISAEPGEAAGASAGHRPRARWSPLGG
jgi:hypothetical protein